MQVGFSKPILVKKGIKIVTDFNSLFCGKKLVSGLKAVLRIFEKKIQFFQLQKILRVKNYFYFASNSNFFFSKKKLK